MKVLLTTSHCNPPLTRTIVCDEVNYFENQHKVSMYATRHGKKRVLIAWAITDEWQAIKIVSDDGREEKTIK